MSNKAPNILPKNNFRYIAWKNSLKKRPPPWNRGLNKEINLSVKKISQTMKLKKIDNFKQWREKMRQTGVIRNTNIPFNKTVKLAILTGMILGDGNIYKFPRTENLRIKLNLKYPKLITYISLLVESIFKKKPLVIKEKDVNCVRISLYQNNLSKRLSIPSGNRHKQNVGIPHWIWENEKYIIGCLRGLFEAEASLCVHMPTGTYNFAFSNTCPQLLSDVKQALLLLGYHPEVRSNAIRLRKKNEVFQFKQLISFRDYAE